MVGVILPSRHDVYPARAQHSSGAFNWLVVLLLLSGKRGRGMLVCARCVHCDGVCPRIMIPVQWDPFSSGGGWRPSTPGVHLEVVGHPACRIEHPPRRGATLRSGSQNQITTKSIPPSIWSPPALPPRPPPPLPQQPWAFQARFRRLPGVVRCPMTDVYEDRGPPYSSPSLPPPNGIQGQGSADLRICGSADSWEAAPASGGNVLSPKGENARVLSLG